MEQPPVPFTVEDLEEEEEVARRRAHGLDRRSGVVRVMPGRVNLPLSFRGLASSFYNFKFRSDDILLMTYPKSGTIWSAEMLWALKHLDCLHLHDTLAIERTYFLDRDIVSPYRPGDGSYFSRRFLEECPGARWEDGVVLQVAAAHQGSPRTLATHFRFSLCSPSLLDTCKVIYVTRNPRDVCLSFYNYTVLMGSTVGSLSDYAEFFMAGDTANGLFWDHLRQAWERRSHRNLHLMFYEDLKSDQMSELRKLSNFLEMDLSDDQLQKVVAYTSLEKMRAKEKMYPVTGQKTERSFFPHGRVGAWRDTVTPDLEARMDQWIKDESRDIDISFRYK